MDKDFDSRLRDWIDEIMPDKQRDENLFVSGFMRGARFAGFNGDEGELMDRARSDYQYLTDRP